MSKSSLLLDVERFLADDVDSFNQDKVDRLENLIIECNNLMNSSPEDHISDSIYDSLYGLLKKVNPDSELLNTIWEESGSKIDSYMDLLDKNPMMSIETAKSYSCREISNFYSRLPNDHTSYFASYKINGHGIRVVYQNGELVSATSRMRSGGNGKDLTRHMRVLLGDFNDLLSDYDMIELRGELCLPLKNFDRVKSINDKLISPFSAVASLSRPSATDEEIELLDFLCYGLIIDGFTFDSKEDEYNTISSFGYSTPEYIVFTEDSVLNLKNDIEGLVDEFSEHYEDFGYFCDGVVLEVNSRELFFNMGIEGNHYCGNIALKVGVWEQVQYCGYIQTILWTKGKTKLSPVAIVAEEADMIELGEDNEILNMEDMGVLTAQGNRVRRVPLYEPRNILILDAYVGNPLYFRYGGEAGVVPCFPDGRPLSEDSSKDLLDGVNVYYDDIGEDEYIIG